MSIPSAEDMALVQAGATIAQACGWFEEERLKLPTSPAIAAANATLRGIRVACFCTRDLDSLRKEIDEDVEFDALEGKPRHG